MDIALLLVRLVALGLAAHGAQKLFGWFGGYGLAGTGGFFASIGYRPGKLMAAAAGLGELAGGLLIALGLGGPIGAAIAIAVMIPAIGSHWPKFFQDKGGFELALTYLAIALAVAFTGFGAYSLDGLFGIAGAWSGAAAAIAVGAGVVAGLLGIASRRRPAQPEAAGAAA